MLTVRVTPVAAGQLCVAAAAAADVVQRQSERLPLCLPAPSDLCHRCAPSSALPRLTVAFRAVAMIFGLLLFRIGMPLPTLPYQLLMFTVAVVEVAALDILFIEYAVCALLAAAFRSAGVLSEPGG